jgi:hypothetical protein
MRYHRSMTKLTLYLKNETADTIKRIANSQGRTQEEVIQDALSTYAVSRSTAEQLERPLPKGVGCYSSGRSDVSERAEELLRQAARTSR